MPRRRPNPAYFIVAGIFLTMVAMGAGMVIEGNGAASEPPAPDESLVATAIPPTATPPPTPTPEPTAVPEPTPIPDRTVCAEIAGTEYRSAAERAWYVTNCTQSRLGDGAGPAA